MRRIPHRCEYIYLPQYNGPRMLCNQYYCQFVDILYSYLLSVFNSDFRWSNLKCFLALWYFFKKWTPMSSLYSDSVQSLKKAAYFLLLYVITCLFKILCSNRSNNMLVNFCVLTFFMYSFCHSVAHGRINSGSK